MKVQFNPSFTSNYIVKAANNDAVEIKLQKLRDALKVSGEKADVVEYLENPPRALVLTGLGADEFIESKRLIILGKGTAEAKSAQLSELSEIFAKSAKKFDNKLAKNIKNAVKTLLKV